MILAADLAKQEFREKIFRLPSPRVSAQFGSAGVQAAAVRDYERLAEVSHVLWAMQRLAESIRLSQEYCQTLIEMKGIPNPRTRVQRTMVAIELLPRPGSAQANATPDEMQTELQPVMGSNDTLKLLTRNSSLSDEGLKVKIEPFPDKSILDVDFYLFIIRAVVLLASHDIAHQARGSWNFEDRSIGQGVTYRLRQGSQAPISYSILIRSLVAATTALKNEGRFCEVNIHLIASQDERQGLASAIIQVARLDSTMMVGGTPKSYAGSSGTAVPVEVA